MKPGRPRIHKKPLEAVHVRFGYASDLVWVQSQLDALKESNGQRNISNTISALEDFKKKVESGKFVRLA